MAAVCPSVLHFCRLRVTRLDSVGNVAETPNNSYVTANTVQMQLTPDVQSGEERTLTGGCGCIIASAKDPDRFKRWQLELDVGALEPALFEMLLGVDVISSGSDPIGINGVSQLDCDFDPSLCAVEAWADAWTDDAPDPTRPYVYFVWPATFWQFGQNTISNDFWQPKLTGFSRSNQLWGTGPYDDYGETFSVDQWAIVQVPTAPPDADCGYADVTPGS
jgi:hypothetical protein